MKNTLLFIFYSLLAVLCAQCKSNEASKTKKPNILFVLIDDQRNDMLSVAGHPIVKTPTIDELAKNGVRFTNAFVTTPICAASRASILTGLYESKHNYTFGKKPIKKEFVQNSYPYLLKEAGYQTGFVGKFGVKLEMQDSLIPHMFDYYKPSPKNAPHFVTLTDGSKRHSAEVKGDEAVKFIKNQNAEKPFCLSISFNAVHAVDNNKTPGNEGHYPYPRAVADMYENVEIPKPLLSDSVIFENHPEFLKKSLNRERYFWRWDTEEKYQTNMKAYYRMISGYDNVVKRVLVALKEKGLDKNTVIFFSADNGYYMGNRGFAGKWSHYEESLRVPMIIYDPRTPKNNSEKINKNIVLNIDIPTTILDFAGISTPKIHQGKSLLPILNNEKKPWRDSFLVEHRMEHKQIPKYGGIRGKRYVYANYYEQNPPYEYLHDLEKDPNQLENLKDNPAYGDILKTMRSKYLNIEKKIVKSDRQTTRIQCSENGCEGTYQGAEFINGNDVAHQFSNKMSGAVGDKLKELFKKGKYSKVDFSAIEMSTLGMGSGEVVYKLAIPFISVANKCDAYTSFDHVGGWNHTPALEQRKNELKKVLMNNHLLDISDLITTPEGLKEYWIQWKNKNTQVDCK